MVIGFYYMDGGCLKKVILNRAFYDFCGWYMVLYILIVICFANIHHIPLFFIIFSVVCVVMVAVAARMWLQYYLIIVSISLTEFYYLPILRILTVNGICLFWQLNGIWGGVVPPPPKISGTTKGMTMKFLPDVGIHKGARNQKKFLT